MVLNWNELQDKWQKRWAEANIGKATVDHTKQKFMMIFAYPGISGFLHVGHMRGFSYTDAICRLERMKGKQVLFPVGTHASGNHTFALAKKMKSKDKDWIEYLLRNGCPESKFKDLEDPNKIIEYFNEIYVEEYWKKFGFLADWERFTSTTHKDYEKFIQWQFRKLHEKNLLVQNPYFATACINCGPVAVDPSETDISKGGNAEKNEYTLLKFKFGKNYLVAATLRPETVFGQTNLWINPDAVYVKVQVENETWIMSKIAADKLRYQKDEVILQEEVDVKTLLGKEAIAPAIHTPLPILPASFVDANVGSGIVTCVPSDAPYDYVALTELWERGIRRATLQTYGISTELVDDIKLIPIIQSKGFGNFPAKEIVEKLGIKNLNDTSLLETATKEIYKAGFHSGILKENCGKYAGQRVSVAKESVKLDLIQDGSADVFHDLSEEVICRCGAPVIIKRIDDQWFIKYSDPDLTQKSKAHVAEMTIYPQDYKENMPSVLDWFQNRACARLGKWMGSKFPLDSKWTVEPISDSTLYPIYYIVSGFVKRGELLVEDLTDDFFDYVFLANDEALTNSTIQEEKKAIWQKVREECDYFYPLDINLGGKEHKTVHFPVFLMNHVGILPHDKWPKGIFVNWWVTGKGGKISKSKGGAQPIPNAIEKYGVDAMRLYYAHIGSPHVDVVWDEDVVIHYKNTLEKIEGVCSQLASIQENVITPLDDWLTSEFYSILQTINTSLKIYNLRNLSSLAYFSITDIFKWYIRRGGKSKRTCQILMTEWIKLLCPITPHLAEELAVLFDCKEKEFVSTSTWPKTNESNVSSEALSSEELVRQTMEGMRSVIKLAKLENPKKFTLYIAQGWLYDVFHVVQSEIAVTRNMGEIIRKVLEVEDMYIRGKEISKVIGMLLKDVSKMPKVITSMEAEYKTLKGAAEFLSKEFDIEVEVIPGENTDHPKAKSALPGKVGIVLE
jgi:leucyl-tRNA synthetase